MTDEEFNNRCLEDYNSYTCKNCKHFEIINNNLNDCKEFTGINIEADFTCKLWEKKDD